MQPYTYRQTGLFVGLWLLILWASAQMDTPTLEPGAFGTRPDTPLTRVAPAESTPNWAQLGIALLIVAAGLRWGLPKLLRWVSKTGDGSPLDGQVRILEARSAPGGTLLLVKAREKLLLVGATPQGMQLLADLTDTLPPPAPTRDSPFEQILRRATPTPPPPDSQQEAAAYVQARLRETCQRLQHLLGGD